MLLVLWPTPEQPEEVIKTTDMIGERLRTPAPDMSQHGAHRANGIRWVCIRDGVYHLGDQMSEPASITVRPGIASGSIAFTIQVTLGSHGRRPPPEQNFDDWDDIIEFSLNVTYAAIHEWDGTIRTDLGNLCQHGPGTYRFRLHARTRDDVIEHLLQSWPAPPEDNTTLKATGILNIVQE
jgi:hypothetical protein